MTELMQWINQRCLTLEEIQKMEQEHENAMVLVNVDHIYFTFSEKFRRNLNQEYNILREVISEIYDEKEMYAPMKVKDVVQCFENNNINYPLNTFLRRL